MNETPTCFAGCEPKRAYNKDENFMRRALVLAARGARCVSPNPMVGAVIVKNGMIISEGWHKRFGGPHAEVDAIKKALSRRKKISGATLYVNLEPCSHFAKTPPCVNAILQAGISRIVIGMKDPNPAVAGRGMRFLRRHGIRVDCRCLGSEAEKFNEKFSKWITTGKPYVCVKVAMSLDGKIATKTGESKWITSQQARNFAHKLRDDYAAVIIGVNTLLKDNPFLAGRKNQPLRIVLDSSLKSKINSHFFRNKNALIIATSRAPAARMRMFGKEGFEIKVFPKKITIAPLLRYLGKKGIASVLVEGGSEVFGSFVDSREIDKFYWFVAPLIIGGQRAAPAIGGQGVNSLDNAIIPRNLKIRKIGRDFMLEGKSS